MRLIPLFLGITCLAFAETPARQVLDAWFTAFNSGDRTKIAAFWNRYDPDRKPPIEQDLRFRDQTGGFKLVRVLKDDGNHIEALAEERDGGAFASFVVNVDSAEPPKITGFQIRGTQPPADLVPTVSSQEELVKIVHGQVEAWAARDRFAGTVLIARNGAGLMERAWGLADRTNKKRNTIETQFRIGSMNKMFTSVAVLQLVQRGKLSLDGTIADYWPDYPNKDLASKVKIRHLLSHTGGTGDIFGPEFDKKRLELKTLADYVTLYGERPLAFEPGSRFAYSNYGFLLLGLLIEKASGKSYYDYVRESIYKPAGMTSTDSLPETDYVPDRSVGYLKGRKGWEPNNTTLPWRGTSAGGGYATVRDLMQFADALRTGKLINHQLLAEATKPQSSNSNYGFGFQSNPDGSFGHGGGAPGMNGELRIYPNGYVVAVLANLDPPSAMKVMNFISMRIPKE